MDSQQLYQRYLELQQYVGWCEEDCARIRSVSSILEPVLFDLVADFYQEIQRHADAMQVITGGETQIHRLKGTLLAWLKELLSGTYDRDYVEARWKVGCRHVEIGLDQTYTNVALSRLRTGLISALEERLAQDDLARRAAILSLNKLLDLDLAIIESAYQHEYQNRERKIQHRQLTIEKERSELAFRQLVEVAGSVIVILRPDGNVAYLNPFAEELTGSSADDLLDDNFFRNFFSASERPVAEKTWMSVLDGPPIRRYENQILNKDGLTCWMVWNVQRLNDYGGQPAILSVGQDITEHKHAEARLLRSERLAAMGKALTGLAHESRNALQRSQAGLEMLARRVANQPEALQLIDRIQHAQDDLHRLYEEVREYAAPVQFSFRSASLSDILHEEWNHLAVQRSGRTARLREELDGVELACEVDPFAIRQCFRNVLENALAASESPLEIQVTYAEANIDGSPAVEVAISDNGPGLTPEQQRRIFDEFFTTKTHGTGLGMAICKRFVEAHGGRIEALSEKVSGTAIRMTLPRKQK